jgi:hypothetical protein
MLQALAGLTIAPRTRSRRIDGYTDTLRPTGSPMDRLQRTRSLARSYAYGARMHQTGDGRENTARRGQTGDPPPATAHRANFESAT